MSDDNAIAILAVDDDERFRDLLAAWFKRQGYTVEVAASPSDSLQLAERRHFDVAILDLALPEMDGVELLEQLRQVDPDTQAIMLTGHGTIEKAVRAMQLGAYTYITKPCTMPELALQVDHAYEKARLSREKQNLSALLRRSERPTEIIGSAPVFRQVLHMVDKVAPTSSPVLILGESGTGKELIARALHHKSPRSNEPLVAVNCAALQETLLESELFGHEKGAFTSAVETKQGLFELAHKGTLFVDEIVEMAPGIQAKLLRALEDGRFRRVGGVKEIKTDVRIVAATNRDIKKEVDENRFRSDLYFRLNVITVHLPRLRDRPEDIPLLVQHCLALNPFGPRAVESDALEALERYAWPGNVRELANVIERAKILAEGPRIALRDLPAEIVNPAPARKPAVSHPDGSGPELQLESLERDHIKHVLNASAWNKSQAARTLGITRRRLYYLIQKYDIAK